MDQRFNALVYAVANPEMNNCLYSQLMQTNTIGKAAPLILCSGMFYNINCSNNGTKFIHAHI